jgi:spermidine synthase
MAVNIIRRRGGRVEVSEEGGVRYLHLGNDAVQSAMRLARPVDLELAYTRAMMACLLLHPGPREFCMIGLGGGSIATFIHRNLPDARIRVVELNREVIAVARSMFGLPQDDARLTVEAGDGALFVASAAERADVLMVDGFNRLAQVHALATRRFYERAVSNLRSGGMLVVNLLQDDSGLDAYLKRIEAACRGGTLCLEAKGEPNLIVFGFRDPVPTLRWDVLKARALQLERATGMRFGSFLQGLRRLNPSTQTYLKPSRGGLL